MGTVMLTGRSRGRPASVRDPAGVERLYRAQRLNMVRLALLLVDDRETAEDVAQDAFAALHRQWPTLANEEAALAYLRRCVVNGARSVLRRRRTVRQHPQPDEIKHVSMVSMVERPNSHCTHRSRPGRLAG